MQQVGAAPALAKMSPSLLHGCLKPSCRMLVRGWAVGRGCCWCHLQWLLLVGAGALSAFLPFCDGPAGWGQSRHRSCCRGVLTMHGPHMHQAVISWGGGVAAFPSPQHAPPHIPIAFTASVLHCNVLSSAVLLQESPGLIIISGKKMLCSDLNADMGL